MRCLAAVFAISLFLALEGPAPAASPDLDDIITNENPEELCSRLAADPFVGFGPEEWAHPFGGVDHYRALPACLKALEKHPKDQSFALGVVLANIAGRKVEATKPLLKALIAEGNASAMLALAFISPEAEAAPLMRKAGEAGNANGTMLYGMTLMTGKGVPKNALEGVRLIRQAADKGSTRAMLLMANFYNQGVYGVGLNPGEGTRLIVRAAELGDPAAKNILVNAQEGTDGASQ
jgi:TPR repeat protein